MEKRIKQFIYENDLLDKSNVEKINIIKKINSFKLKSPILKLKLMLSEKEIYFNKIVSRFFDCNENRINPLDFLNKKSNVQCAIKIESFVICDNEIKLQLKLYECFIEKIQMKKLLKF